MVEMKPYVKVFMKAVLKTSKQSAMFKQFANGLMGQVPKDVLIGYLNQSELDVKLFIKNTVEYFAKYILRDLNIDKDLAAQILAVLDKV